MRVLLLTQHFWPETFAINQVAVDLQAQGCTVTVLTGKPNYPAGRIFDGYEAWGTQQEVYEGMEVLRVPLWPRGRGGAVRLVLNYLSFILSASWLGGGLLRERQFDVVFVYATSPLLQALAALHLKRSRGWPVAVWVQDLWPDSLRITGYVHSAFVLRAVERVVRWIYSRSDLLLAQSRGFEGAMRPLAGRTPIAYHPNPGRRPGVESQHAEDFEELPRGFRIVFAGNLGRVQALETVLEAAALLGPASDIRWILVGDGSMRGWLEQEVQSRGLEQQVFLPGRMHPSRMPGLYRCADALLVSLCKDETLAQTVPSKLQDYLSAGRPVLAALDGDGADIVRTSGGGLASPAQDAASLASAAQALAALTPEQRAQMGARGRAYFEAEFHPDLLGARLAALLRSVAA